MTQQIAPSDVDTTVQTQRTTRALLACGVLAGPLFVAVVVIQMLTREGFDPKAHPLSLLSVGGPGWIQITNFVLAGLLFLASAVGLRRALRPGRAGTWAPILVGVFGVSLVWGGVFVTDPSLGFPPGTAAGILDDQSWHSILHAIAPVAGSIALFVACFVYARRFAGFGQRGWAAYSVVTGVVSPILSTVATPADDFRLMFAGGVLLWGWVSVMAARQLSSLSDA